MRVRWDLVVLFVLLSMLLWVRMELASQTPTLSYDSYSLVRSVDHILSHGTPLRTDPLSVTGYVRITNPVFDYILAAMVLLSPLFYKLLPNICMVLLLVPLYSLALRTTGSKIAAFAGVILAATAPLALGSYLVTPAAAPLGLLLLFTIIAVLHDTQKYLLLIIGLTLLLTFISPVIFLLVGALLAVTLLLRVEGFGIDRRVNELFFFTLVLATWFYVLVYKNALFVQGLNVLWQNLPSQVAALTFRNVTFIDAITGIGVVSFLLGAIGTYYALFEQRDRSSYAVVGTMIAVIAALLWRIVSLEIGLLILSLLLAVMAGQGLLVLVQYIRRTKAPWVVYPFISLVAMLFLLSSLLPALVHANNAIESTPSAQDVASFQQLTAQLPPQAVMLAPIKESAAIQYYSNRTTYTDSDFLLVAQADTLAKEIDDVYTARFSTNILSRAERLGFSHVLFTRLAQSTYQRESILVQNICIAPQQVGNAVLYTVTCTEEQ